MKIGRFENWLWLLSVPGISVLPDVRAVFSGSMVLMNDLNKRFYDEDMRRPAGLPDHRTAIYIIFQHGSFMQLSTPEDLVRLPEDQYRKERTS